MFKRVEISSRKTDIGAYRFDVTAITHRGDRFFLASDASYENVILLTEGFGGDYGEIVDRVGADEDSGLPKRASTWRGQLAARRVLQRAMAHQQA